MLILDAVEVGTTVGIRDLVYFATVIGALVGVWINSRLSIQKNSLQIKQLKEEIVKNESSRKEDKAMLNGRIDGAKDEIQRIEKGISEKFEKLIELINEINIKIAKK